MTTEEVRLKWESRFKENGISRTDLLSMSDERFHECLELLRNASKPWEIPKKSCPIYRQTSNEIRRDQNDKYALLEEEFLSEQRKAELSEQNDKQTIEQKREEIRQLALKIPEPVDGVEIVIGLPEKRIKRKFDIDRQCSDLYCFVANQDCMFDTTGKCIEFELYQGPTLIDENKTFREQRITKRTLVQLSLSH